MIKVNNFKYYNTILIVVFSLISTNIALSQTSPSKTTINAIKKIVLDPGHGGKDPGCSGHGSKEKEIVLKIGMAIKEKLNQGFPNIEVVLTRDSDIFVPLYERAKIANDLNADLFLSIHCNAISHSGTKGTETFIMGLHTERENFDVAKRENASIFLEQDYQANYDGFDPNSLEAHIFLTMFQTAHREQSILLADLIEDEMVETGHRRSRGVKEAGFVVLRATAMPSVLVENGFLTHKTESEFLQSNDGIDIISKSIFNAIKRYKKKVESKLMIPPVEQDKGSIAQKNITQSNSNPEKIKTVSITVKNKITFYAIQLFALSVEKSPEELGLSSLSQVKVEYIDGMYKYFSGHFYNRMDADKALAAIRQLGFENAFIKRFD